MRIRNATRYRNIRKGREKNEMNRYSILESPHFLHLSKKKASKGADRKI